MKHSDDSVQLLTVGNGTYTSDNRLAISWRYPGNWTLQISHVELHDAGCYQCQVNTHPPIGLFVQLHVQGEWWWPVLIRLFIDGLDRSIISYRRINFAQGIGWCWEIRIGSTSKYLAPFLITVGAAHTCFVYFLLIVLGKSSHNFHPYFYQQKGQKRISTAVPTSSTKVGLYSARCQVHKVVINAILQVVSVGVCIWQCQFPNLFRKWILKLFKE